MNDTDVMALPRRRLLQAAGASVLAAPAIVRAAVETTLRFIPQADLAVLDPVWTSAYVTRNHAFMVFDTLYGQDGAFRPQPQMVTGAVVEDDHRVWRLGLRGGLRFHDGTPVLARDCVASIQRWGKRDSFGQSLMAVTDEVSAPDDQTILFRLKTPFPLLPDALGKAGPNMCPIMPERLAATDPFKQVTEMVGSGPFRFNTADERVVRLARVVYAKFADYVPRPSECQASLDRRAEARLFYDRVEWHVIPDVAADGRIGADGAARWIGGTMLPADLLPLLRHARPKLHVFAGSNDPACSIAAACGSTNCSHPSTIRRSAGRCWAR